MVLLKATWKNSAISMQKSQNLSKYTVYFVSIESKICDKFAFS